jgi:hypothetical protein
MIIGDLLRILRDNDKIFVLEVCGSVSRSAITISLSSYRPPARTRRAQVPPSDAPLGVAAERAGASERLVGDAGSKSAIPLPDDVEHLLRVELGALACGMA